MPVDDLCHQTRPFRYERCAPFLRSELENAGTCYRVISIGKAPKEFIEGHQEWYGQVLDGIPWIWHYGFRIPPVSGTSHAITSRSMPDLGMNTVHSMKGSSATRTVMNKLTASERILIMTFSESSNTPAKMDQILAGSLSVRGLLAGAQTNSQLKYELTVAASLSRSNVLTIIQLRATFRAKSVQRGSPVAALYERRKDSETTGGHRPPLFASARIANRAIDRSHGIFPKRFAVRS